MEISIWIAAYIAVNCFIAGQLAAEVEMWESYDPMNVVGLFIIFLVGLPLKIAEYVWAFLKWIAGIFQLDSYWRIFFTDQWKKMPQEEYLKWFTQLQYQSRCIEQNPKAPVAARHLSWIWKKFLRQDGVYMFGSYFKGDLNFLDSTYRFNAFVNKHLPGEYFDRFVANHKGGQVWHLPTDIVHNGVYYQLAGVRIIEVSVNNTSLGHYSVVLHFDSIVKWEGPDGVPQKELKSKAA